MNSPVPTLIGRSSSHFTRLTRVFAHELGVATVFRPVFDLASLDTAAYGENPALKIPILVDLARPSAANRACRAAAAASRRRGRRHANRAGRRTPRGVVRQRRRGRRSSRCGAGPCRRTLLVHRWSPSSPLVDARRCRRRLGAAGMLGSMSRLYRLVVQLRLRGVPIPRSAH
ncbi:MAG: hypothetical protein U0271_10325 [Polyangiaceae bacterium]